MPVTTLERKPAMFGLADPFDKPVTDYSKMLELSGLAGWDVHMQPSQTPEGYTRLVESNDVLATIDGEKVLLGTAGKVYAVLDNEWAFAWAQTLQDGSAWVNAGFFKGGRVVFATMAWEEPVIIDPKGANDRVDTYLLTANSFDGSVALGGGTTMVRPYCMNSLTFALKTANRKFSIRHTETGKVRAEVVAEIWRNQHAYVDAFQAEANALFEKSVTDAKFKEIFESLWPSPVENKKGSEKKWDTRRENNLAAWNGKPNANIKGTAWGAVNALTEADQWYRNVRKADNGLENFYAAGAGFDTVTENYRNKVLVTVKNAVGIK